MAEGIRKLRSVRFGREGTAGTACATTTRWRGTGVLIDERVKVTPEEDVSIISGTDRQYEPMLGGTITTEGVATFEQIGHIFDAGIVEATPATDGTTGSGRIYTWTFPTTAAASAIQSYTIEGGDNIRYDEMEYSYVESFNLSGTVSEAVMVSAVWKGRQVQICAVTTAATIPAVEEILFQEGKLYIDAITGTQGNTPKTSTWRAFNLDCKTGWKGEPTGDGEKYFTFLKNVGSEITLDITMEHNATATAEIDYWRAGTARLITLKFEGSSLDTAGTTYSLHTLAINLAGKWESFAGLEDSDGNDTITGTFKAGYDPTSTSYASIVLAADTTTLP